MTERRDNSTGGVNPGYAVFQIAKALTTSEQHDDPSTRERAKERVEKFSVGVILDTGCCDTE